MDLIRRINKHIKGKLDAKGFSLLEIIISVAALSFVGVFIVQMFISSSNLNTKARNVDFATSEAVTALEGFKRLTLYDGGDATTGKYYDKDWRELEFKDLNELNSSEEVYFVLKMSVTLEEELETGGCLYAAEAVVTDISGDEDKVIASLSTKKYFSDVFY